MDLFVSTHTSETPIFLRLLVLFLQETERNVPTQRPISKVRERIYVYLCLSDYTYCNVVLICEWPKPMN